MRDPPQIKLMLAVIISVFGFVVIILFLLWHYRLDIRLFHHIKCGSRQQGNTQFENDIMLIHSGTRQDYPFVRHILYHTLQNSHRVYLPEEAMDPDKYIDEAYIYAMRSSATIILVLTEDFLKQTIWGQVHDYLLNERRTDVIYVQYGHIDRDLWQNNQFIGNVDVLHRAVKNASRSFLGLGKKLRWRQNFSVPGSSQPLVEDRNFSKQIGKFWGQLSLYLPPVRRRENGEGEVRRPLVV